MRRKPKHPNDTKPDILSLQRAALLREIDGASLSDETKHLLRLVAVQPGGVDSGRAALDAALRRAESEAR